VDQVHAEDPDGLLLQQVTRRSGQREAKDHAEVAGRFRVVRAARLRGFRGAMPGDGAPGAGPYRGKPSTRCAMMLRCTSLVPPAIVKQRL